MVRDPWHDGREVWKRLRAWLSDQSLQGQNGEQALDALSDVCSLRALLDRVELAAVRVARREGRSWSEIATRLGVTRQSAWERWRDADDVPPAQSLPPGDEAHRLRAVHAELAQDLVAGAARQYRRRSTVKVPSVIGLSFDEARSVLSQHGLVAVGPDPDGPPIEVSAWRDSAVTDQSPESGAKVPEGSPVTLWLGRGGGSAGVREPRRPSPEPRELRAMRDEQTDEAVG